MKDPSDFEDPLHLGLYKIELCEYGSGSLRRSSLKTFHMKKYPIGV